MDINQRAEIPLRRTNPAGMVFSGIVIGALAGTGVWYHLPEKLGADKANWFWIALAGLVGLMVVIPFLFWIINPRKCFIETNDDLLIIRTGRFGKRKLELSKIESIFVEDNLATIFYRTKRGFPTSWMIERKRFREGCWEKLGETLNSVKQQVRL